MKLFKQTQIKILIAVFLLLGIGVGVYLVKNPQIFKGKATAGPADHLQVNSSGQSIQKINDPNEAAEFGGSENVPVYRVQGSTFTVNYSR